MKEKISEQGIPIKPERKLFEKRKRSTEIMTIFNRRYINNLRKNWEIKQKDHLLPKIDTIFDFIERDLSEMAILGNLERITEWWQVVKDEEFIEKNIQENIAILSWVYWQRLEGYEILDVSLSRERLVEDIGCIQQFYNAADGLILEYQKCFNIQMPIDIMCVYGLYEHFHTNFRHFVMVPNQTRYEYISAGVSVAHEVAHIAIDEIENNYVLWLNKKSIEREKTAIGETTYIKKDISKLKIENNLEIGLIPSETLEISNNFKNFINEICSEIGKDDKAQETLLTLANRLDNLHSRMKELRRPEKDCQLLCMSLYRDLDMMSDIISALRVFLELSLVPGKVKKKVWKELRRIEFKILSLVEVVLDELFTLKLFDSSRTTDIDLFFENWKRIKRRAIDVAETVLRLTEGETGSMYLHEYNLREMKHVYISEHILADIIATLIAGEFYIYSLTFYRFLPSVFSSEEGVIYRKQLVPMSLRLLICLETLKITDWDDMKYLVEGIEELWNKLAWANNIKETGEIGVEKEKIEKEFQKITSEISDETCKVTAELLWNLIKSIIEEDSCLEKKYNELLEKVENGTEETKDRFDKSYFSYMRHALGNTLKQMLRDSKGFVVGTDSRGNPLEELIRLVKDTLIDPAELFTTKERYDIMNQIKNNLIRGEFIFDVEKCDKKGESNQLYNWITPRNILSAYAQIYFESILIPRKNNYDYINVFNATVMSMAWTQYTLERFHDGMS